MKSVSFYKPNAYNKGSASQFQFGLKSGDDGLYVSIVKQFSWDNAAKKGSFSGNAQNPAKNKKCKFTTSEAGAICLVVSGLKDKWSTVHKSGEKMTSISFSPYVKDGVKMGYGFSISGEKGGEGFMLSLTNEEGYVLKAFLDEYIASSFEKSAPKEAGNF
jgi:hypothetical protein